MNICLHCGNSTANQKFCSRSCSGKATEPKRIATLARRDKALANYMLTPKHCKYCNIIIQFEKRVNNFCNHRCSSLFNNPTRTLKEIKDKILSCSHCGVKSKPLSRHSWNFFCDKCRIDMNKRKIVADGLFTPIFFRCCKNCNNQFVTSTKRQCYDCRVINIPLYRKDCKFNLSPKDHPELFDSDLIKEYGWYSPTNSISPNVTGLTWDHLFRVSEGRKLKSAQT